MEVRNPSDDDFEVAASVHAACLAEWAPGEPPVPAAELAADVVHAPAAEPMRLFRAGDEGYLVASLPSAGSNEHLVYAWDLLVRPSARRRGVGRAIVEAAREVLGAEGRTLLIGISRVGDEGSATFCRSAGAKPDLVEQINRCSLADVDRGLLEGWVTDAATGAAGYSLVTFDGPVSDDLLLDFARVAQAMNDAPRSERMEATALSTEAEREIQDSWVAMGFQVLSACARHDETGDLAGYTQLLVNPFRPWLAFQYGTGVLHAHRGHGIGRWLKAVNALRLLDEHPQVTTIETDNASTNAPMLAINHAMGFRLFVAHQTWELDL